MKLPTFEDFLKETYAHNYTGTDDDMPDAFDSWLSELEGEEWLDFGNRYGAELTKILYGPVPDMTGEVL